MGDIFSKRLKQLRIERGKTQKEIADELNVKRTTYGEYERGKISPPVEKIKTLAEILNTTPQYLLGWENIHAEHDDNVTGNIIKKLREQRNISSKEFAKEINISVSDLKKYEDGTYQIPMTVINLIADYYNISVGDLIDAHMEYSNKNKFTPMQKERFRKFGIWTKEFSNVVFTNEEVEKIIDYAKYLLHQRKEHER